MPVTIRQATASDLDAVLALNQTNLPAVGPLDEERLAHLVEISVCVSVADDDGIVVGMLIGLDGPGRDYSSHNYAWFSERFDRFIYVDRIVVADSHQGQGIGRRLYEDFVARSAGEQTHLLAEVNVRPRNEASLAFHERFGFEALEEREIPDGSVRVVMLAKALDRTGHVPATDEDLTDALPATDEDLTDARSATDELGGLEADVATVERVLDRFHELEPGERAAMLDALDGGVAAEPPAQA